MDKGSVLHNLEKSGESQNFFHDSMVIEAFENQRYFIRLFNEYEVNFSNVETYSECVIRVLDIDRIYRYKHYHDTDDNGINCYLEIYCRSKFFLMKLFFLEFYISANCFVTIYFLMKKINLVFYF